MSLTGGDDRITLSTIVKLLVRHGPVCFYNSNFTDQGGRIGSDCGIVLKSRTLHCHLSLIHVHLTNPPQVTPPWDGQKVHEEAPTASQISQEHSQRAIDTI